MVTVVGILYVALVLWGFVWLEIEAFGAARGRKDAKAVYALLCLGGSAEEVSASAHKSFMECPMPSHVRPWQLKKAAYELSRDFACWNRVAKLANEAYCEEVTLRQAERLKALPKPEPPPSWYTEILRAAAAAEHARKNQHQ